MQASDKKEFLFLKSAFEPHSSFGSTHEIRSWLEAQNRAVSVTVSHIPFEALKQWAFDPNSGAIRHESGRFFSIDGIRVKTNWGPVQQWDQPIINQPEVGYLGFITKEINGVLHFLLQAKIEPGNVNHVQLSPTIQATRSNYTQVHKGKKPLYLDYFLHVKPENVLLDQLQSEQGARFLKKRNRNIIIRVEEEIPQYDNFIWLTLAHIKELMTFDNLVNMDTRTVISAIPYGNFDEGTIDLIQFLSHDKKSGPFSKAFLKSAVSPLHALHTIDEIINFLTGLKSVYDLDIEKRPLQALEQWQVGKSEIARFDQRFFKIIAVDVSISNREVVNWTQPMVEPAQGGICAFICKEINGVMHFAVQAKLECGNFDIIEFAPTVQCLTGDYRVITKTKIPFLDYVLNAKPDQIVFDALQSEEGGRFYKEQNRNMLVVAGDDLSNELPEKYIWMTLNQLYTFLKFNNFLNIQARSLISAIRFTS